MKNLLSYFFFILFVFIRRALTPGAGETEEQVRCPPDGEKPQGCGADRAFNTQRKQTTLINTHTHTLQFSCRLNSHFGESVGLTHTPVCEDVSRPRRRPPEPARPR